MADIFRLVGAVDAVQGVLVALVKVERPRAQLRAAPARTPEEEKADEEARAAWQTRCRPSVVEDREGIRRTQYAEPDCDLSRFNTAGK